MCGGEGDSIHTFIRDTTQRDELNDTGLNFSWVQVLQKEEGLKFVWKGKNVEQCPRSRGGSSK